MASLLRLEVFTAVGMQAMVGRTFTAGRSAPGAPRVAVVGDRFWRALFTAIPPRSERTVVAGGEPYTIVGACRPARRFPSRTTDVWLPLGRFVPTFPADRGAHPGSAPPSPRLKPGITVPRASADMDAIARRLEQPFPASNADHTVLVQPYYDQIVQIGKSAQQRNLAVGKRLDLDASDSDDTNNRVISEHRNRKNSPMHLVITAMIFGPPIIAIAENVVDVDDFTLQDSPSGC